MHERKSPGDRPGQRCLGGPFDRAQSVHMPSVQTVAPEERAEMKVRNPDDGRFGFDGNMDRICVCGHLLGVHGPRGIECLAGTNVPDDPNPPGVECSCTRFKPAPAPRTVSVECYYDRCREKLIFQLEKGAKKADASHELDEIAGKLGWVIGLDRAGQAQHACPDHAFSLVDAMPLADMRKREKRRRALSDSVTIDRS